MKTEICARLKINSVDQKEAQKIALEIVRIVNLTFRPLEVEMSITSHPKIIREKK